MMVGPAGLHYPSSPLLLMKWRVEALFVLDDNGRLVFVNEPWAPEEKLAPLLYMGQTDEGSICRCRYDVPAALCHELAQVVETYADSSPTARSPVIVEARRRLEQAGMRTGRAGAGPAYRFPAQCPPDEACVEIDSSAADLLRAHFDDIIPELDTVSPCVVLVEEGNAVSICRCVRRSPRMVEAGVETATAYRGRGFGGRVVATWASLVRAQGITPIYSTSWDNAASRRLAAKLGMVQFGTDLSLAEGER